MPLHGVTSSHRFRSLYPKSTAEMASGQPLGSLGLLGSVMG